MTDKRYAGDASETSGADAKGPWPMQDIEGALRGMRFGSVTIIVQDGVVIQLERTEKRRFQRRGSQR